jgi:hypothetical protein
MQQRRMGTGALFLAGALMWMASPGHASAASYMLHLGGLCSTDYLGGKGSATLFDDWSGVTPVNLRIDQRFDHNAAVAEVVDELDTYCRGTDDCYMIVHSNGGAVIAQALSIYGGTPGHDWNINWVVHQGSNTGGSNLSDIAGTWYARWLAELVLCDMADEVTPDIHRATFDHNDTDGVTFYMLAGFDTWWYSDWFVPDEDDGAVGMDSAAGYVSEGRYPSACGTTRWSNHVPAWFCGFDRDHYSIKNAARDCLRTGASSLCYRG